MLGEQIGNMGGEVIGQRVLEPDHNGPRLETTIQMAGSLYEVEIGWIATYVACFNPDGSLTGEANGVVMGTDGSSAAVKAGGTGHLQIDGSSSWRGHSTFQTTSDSLSKLNGLYVIFEFESAADGSATGAFWEWN